MVISVKSEINSLLDEVLIEVKNEKPDQKRLQTLRQQIVTLLLSLRRGGEF